ncbi:hypothetical protein FB565_000565 [Actinoplanes lutulentus]|uniref:Uncharacterized protein n=1 Tax=Actinoplanes lutulentus TaxID=1287878 RepID=A0A327ZL73_9ACTN|nr:hypothetical protein [Actinoplanes lutulentus]MBB2940861.1 hypothetical protein [Actinoplanes lutulentus]RAK43170.1 hypothetical protein B0I29_101300 [Actinoplanes lutulentus]
MKIWGVARILLVLLWIAGAASTWWTAPREVSYERALAAVSSGEVRAYQWGNGWDGSERWFEAKTLTSRGDAAPYFVWRTSDQRVYWTDTTLAAVDQESVIVDGIPHGGGAAPIARQLTQQEQATVLNPWSGWLQGISLVLALTSLIVVISGPAPVRGTRWYWFWMVALIPYGIGLVFWLFRDRPWASAEPDPAKERDRGWFGVVTAILANLVIALALLPF